jgi:hypothetical protein
LLELLPCFSAKIRGLGMGFTGTLPFVKKMGDINNGKKCIKNIEKIQKRLSVETRFLGDLPNHPAIIKHKQRKKAL